MKAKERLEKVKMNLSLEKEFFDLLQKNAADDYMLVSTWTIRLLKKSLLGDNKNAKPVNENENAKKNYR